jgi:hypothetical protein
VEFPSNSQSSTTTAAAMTNVEGLWSPHSEAFEEVLPTDAFVAEVSAVLDCTLNDITAHDEAVAKSNEEKLFQFCSGFLDTAGKIFTSHALYKL